MRELTNAQMEKEAVEQVLGEKRIYSGIKIERNRDRRGNMKEK